MKFYVITTNNNNGKTFQKTMKKHKLNDYIYVKIKNMNNFQQGFQVKIIKEINGSIFYIIDPIVIDVSIK